MPRSDSHTNGSKKRGTATEHAKQQKRGTATEHAKQPVVMKPNAQTQQYMEQAQADRANNTFEHLLFLLADFLTHVLRELCPRVAAQCEDVVFDKIADWAATSSDRPSFYNESELLLHKKMWDVINRDVRGVPKEHFFVQWCRRISMHRTNGDATNSASIENADNGNRFRRMAEDFCSRPDAKTKERPKIPASRRQNPLVKTAQPRQQYLAKKHGRCPDRFVHTRPQRSYITGSTSAEKGASNSTVTEHAA